MKTLYPITFVLLITSVMTSCSTYERTSNQAYSVASGEDRLMASKEELPREGSNVEKKVIYSSTVDLTVKVPDTAAVRIAEIAKKYNGYVQQSGTTMCVIRVEASHLKAATESVCSLGKVNSKSSYGEDVTDQYLDYSIRLENAEKARARYLELLAKAENVEAALLVEKELERLNETIELMKGRMNRIDHLVNYSTITIYLKEKKKPGVLGYIGIGLYQAVKWLFVRN